MTEREHEAWYDAEISPRITEIVKMLAERKLSCVFTSEYDPGLTAISCHLEPDAGANIRVAFYGAKCTGNVDGMIISIVRDTQITGKDQSIVLGRFMGKIP